MAPSTRERPTPPAMPTVVTVTLGMSRGAGAMSWLAAIAIAALAIALLCAAGSTPVVGAAGRGIVSDVVARLTPSAQSAAATVGGVGSAAATGPAGSDPDDAVDAAWDGPAVHLDWSGDGYARAEASFVGDRVASPGDRVERTLNVVNAGPSASVMTVSLDAATIVPDATRNAMLGDDIELFWRVGDLSGQQPFSAFAAQGTTVLAELATDRGATVPITLGFTMPVDVEGSRAESATSTELVFDLAVALRGETAQSALPATGGAVPIPLIAAGSLIAALGTAFIVVAARRRRRDDTQSVRP